MSIDEFCNPFSRTVRVEPVRYGLMADFGIVLDVDEIRPDRRRKAPEGATLALSCGDWGLGLAVRGDELRALHAHLGNIIDRMPKTATEVKVRNHE